MTELDGQEAVHAGAQNAAGAYGAVGCAPGVQVSTVPERIFALQRTAGNQAVQRALDRSGAAAFEAAFNADFSDVTLHRESSVAAELGARALTLGTEIHFAPGEYRAHSEAGHELIAHELAHVVQQRNDRAAPRVQAKGPAAIDDSPELEAEADAQARLAVRGMPARAGAAFSAPKPIAAPVVQGDFRVSSTLTAQGERNRAPGDLKIAAVQMTDKIRPPTALPKGRQGRHTVAWAGKVAYWKELFGGLSVEAALHTVLGLARDDEAVDATLGAGGGALRTRLIERIEAELETKQKTTSQWIELVTWALTTYVKAYQQSAFSSFRSTNPKGRNEAGHLAELGGGADEEDEALQAEVEDATAKGDLSTMTARPLQGDAALADNRGLVHAAFGLLDLHPNLDVRVLRKVFKDWVAMITTLNPALRAIVPSDRDIDAIAVLGYDHVKHLKRAMLDAAAKPSSAPTMPVSLVAPAGESDAESPEGATTERPDDRLSETEPFLVRASIEDDPDAMDVAEGEADDMEVDEGEAAGGRHGLREVTVSRLVVSGERPPTTAGARQMSHTIPWSLERLAWTRAFSGQSLRAVVTALEARLGEEQQWAGAGSDERKDLASQRGELVSSLRAASGQRKTIAGWTRWLDEAIETYVTLYQRSPFATYGTEPVKGDSIARGKGEASALEAFKRWEAALKARPTTAIALAGLRKKAMALIDVPQADRNRDRVGLEMLEKRWLDELRTVYPHVFKKYEAILRGAFRDAAEQTPEGKQLGMDLASPAGVTTRTGKRTAGSDERPSKRRRGMEGAIAVPADAPASPADVPMRDAPAQDRSFRRGKRKGLGQTG